MTLWFFRNDSKGMKKGPLTALLYINRGGDSKMYHSVASKHQQQGSYQIKPLCMKVKFKDPTDLRSNGLPHENPAHLILEKIKIFVLLIRSCYFEYSFKIFAKFKLFRFEELSLGPTNQHLRA